MTKKAYITKTVYDEILSPNSVKEQINQMIQANILEVLDENHLPDMEKPVYESTFSKLERVMINPRNPNKNRGEVTSLSMAKVKGIPYFVTDENSKVSIASNTC